MSNIPAPPSAPRSPASASAACRLSGAESHEVFRALLASAARPGTTERLPSSVTRRIPPPIAALAALVDVGVSFHVIGDDCDRWSESLATATGGDAVELAEAWAVAALDGITPAELCRLHRGTALEPERGARLILGGHAGASCAVTLSGPGVPGERAERLTGVGAEVLTALMEVNACFPAGVDTWVCDAAGNVVALPRSTRIRLHDTAKEG